MTIFLRKVFKNIILTHLPVMMVKRKEIHYNVDESKERGMNMSDQFDKDINNENNQEEVEVEEISVNETNEQENEQQKDSTYHFSYVDKEPEVEYVEEIIEEVVEEKPPKKKKRKSSGFGKKLVKAAAYGLVFGLVAGASFQGIRYGLKKAGITEGSDTQLATTQTVSTSSGEKSDLSAVAESVLPSIVSITGTFQISGYGYFGESTGESEGSGSGIIVGKDDSYIYIATNNHVIEDATSLAVGFCDDTSAEAEVKGTDADADLAVVAVKLSNINDDTLDEIKIITMGDSDKLEVGEQAVAIGNALGYGQSVTGGYISALNREVQLTDKTMTLIQTDAAINPGNSGGALLDGDGRLVGINTVKYSSEEVEGMGYAIPINTAKPIIETLIEEKTIPESQQAYLGIVGTDMTEELANAYGMPTGIYVKEIQQGSPAQNGGIEAGDVIVEFDGSSVTTMESLQNRLAKKTAGTKVSMKVKRQNQMGQYEDVTLTVTLGSKSDAE